MPTYTILQQRDETGFQVAIVGGDGARQTLLGFKTPTDARAWIAWDTWLSAAETRLIPPEHAEGAG